MCEYIYNIHALLILDSMIQANENSLPPQSPLLSVFLSLWFSLLLTHYTHTTHTHYTPHTHTTQTHCTHTAHTTHTHTTYTQKHVYAAD